ncbi:MAG TPA: hypothetical protein VGC42_32420, partial [Kofleriaceae bacterium]
HLDLDEMLFLGDRLDKDGNDYPVRALGVACIAVSGWPDTESRIVELLATPDPAVAADSPQHQPRIHPHDRMLSPRMSVPANESEHEPKRRPVLVQPGDPWTGGGLAPGAT